MSQTTPEYIAKLLRQADADAVNGHIIDDFCSRKRISKATYCRCRRV